jgi:hypothetical protein
MKSNRKKLELILNIDTVEYCEFIFDKYEDIFFPNLNVQEVKDITFDFKNLINKRNGKIEDIQSKESCSVSFDSFIDYHLNLKLKHFDQEIIDRIYNNDLPLFLEDIANRLSFIQEIESIQLIQFLYQSLVDLSPQLADIQNEKAENVKNSTVRIETLSDLITIKNSIEISERIKVQYKNIKGKRLKLLLLAFQDLELIPKDRVAKTFHNCCKNDFEWDIASYNAMNGHTYNDKLDEDEFNSMKKFIESLKE